jgi:ABC-type antimicrobial peptide transport system permease subunit
LEPGAPPYAIATFEDVVRRSLWRQRLQQQVLGVFGVLSLILATVGIYGVISYAVAQRSREIGVRMALGASRGQVARWVLGQGARLVVIGVALGMVGAFWLTRALETLLFGVTPTDAITFAGVPLLLGLIALLAILLPARRASQVDPAVSMRVE